MLQSKNLDNQSYEHIMEAVMNRLPTLCPDWTNYNDSDPGITILQLFAWYKEMQQYHLNQMTDALQRKLLRLVGAAPRSARAAECCVELPERQEAYLAETALYTAEGIPFELTRTVRGGGPRVTGVCIEQGGWRVDVTELLAHGAAIQPFLHSGSPSTLSLAVEGCGTLWLWLGAEEAKAFPRVPFSSPEQQPREIRWEWNGAAILPEADETHAMSVSGFLRFRLPDAGGSAALRAVLTDPGCEETVRLTALSSLRCPAVQRETWGKLWEETVPCEAVHSLELEGAFSQRCLFTVFLRTAAGWTQLAQAEELQTASGQRLTLNTLDAAQDGAANLRIAGAALSRAETMFFRSNGLPGQSLQALFEGRQPTGAPFELICDTVTENGSVRPERWRQVDDFYACGPRDRVFVYDGLRETIRFGDGGHGAIVPAGEGAILIASLCLSDCGAGNIPAGYSLRLRGTDAALYCTGAAGGAGPERAEDAAAEFLKRLTRSDKCASAADYARIAKETPGLRVATAKALPGYDPAEPSGRGTRPVVSVVVIPYSREKCPMPDKKFLAAVRERLDRHRSICIGVEALPPRYVGLSVRTRLRAGAGVTQETVAAALERWLDLRSGCREIGQSVSESETAALLQSLPEVWSVERVRIAASAPGRRGAAPGELELPPDGVAYLAELALEKT